MFNVNKEGMLSISRGDSFSTIIFINAGTAVAPIRYELGEKDEVYFALMSPNQSFEKALLIKRYTKEDVNENGDVVVEFEPKDTEFLLPGKYYYQVKLRIGKEDGTYAVNTIIPMTNFIIEE